MQKIQTENKQFISVEFDKETNRNSLKNIPGVFDAKNIKGNTWQIEAHTDKDIRTDIFQYAVQNNLAVLTLQKEEQRLEDVFKHLTK